MRSGQLSNGYQTKLNSILDLPANADGKSNNQTIGDWLDKLAGEFPSNTSAPLNARGAQTKKNEFIDQNFKNFTFDDYYKNALFIAVQQLRKLVDQYKKLVDQYNKIENGSDQNEKAQLPELKKRITNLTKGIQTFTNKLENDMTITEQDIPVKHFYNKDKKNSAYTNVNNIGFFVTVAGKQIYVRSLEAAFQGMKAFSMAEQATTREDKEMYLKLAERLFNSSRKPGKHLQKLGQEAQNRLFLFDPNDPTQQNPISQSADSNTDKLSIEIKEQLMFELLEMKFTQHPALLKDLLVSGEQEIIEDTQSADYVDAFWGNAFDGMGKNALGEALMRLRKKHQEEPYKSKALKDIPVRVAFSNDLCDALKVPQSGVDEFVKREQNAQWPTTTYNEEEKYVNSLSLNLSQRYVPDRATKAQKDALQWFQARQQTPTEYMLHKLQEKHAGITDIYIANDSMQNKHTLRIQFENQNDAQNFKSTYGLHGLAEHAKSNNGDGKTAYKSLLIIDLNSQQQMQALQTFCNKNGCGQYGMKGNKTVINTALNNQFMHQQALLNWDHKKSIKNMSTSGATVPYNANSVKKALGSVKDKIKEQGIKSIEVQVQPGSIDFTMTRKEAITFITTYLGKTEAEAQQMLASKNHIDLQAADGQKIFNNLQCDKVDNKDMLQYLTEQSQALAREKNTRGNADDAVAAGAKSGTTSTDAAGSSTQKMVKRLVRSTNKLQSKSAEIDPFSDDDDRKRSYEELEEFLNQEETQIDANDMSTSTSIVDKDGKLESDQHNKFDILEDLDYIEDNEDSHTHRNR